jgi:hypothetical protein
MREGFCFGLSSTECLAKIGGRALRENYQKDSYIEHAINLQRYDKQSSISTYNSGHHI